jgi:hypothetical protein
MKAALASLRRSLEGLSESDWFAYAAIVLPRLRFTWDMGRFRILTAGDTSSHFVNAYHRFHNGRRRSCGLRFVRRSPVRCSISRPMPLPNPAPVPDHPSRSQPGVSLPAETALPGRAKTVLCDLNTPTPLRELGRFDVVTVTVFSTILNIRAACCGFAMVERCVAPDTHERETGRGNARELHAIVHRARMPVGSKVGI